MVGKGKKMEKKKKIPQSCEECPVFRPHSSVLPKKEDYPEECWLSIGEVENG